jgi:ribose 5-phosphate isomerase B
MKVAIASDHAGFEYKAILFTDLQQAGYEITDLGAYNEQPSDYPDHAKHVSLAILKGEAERGIIICGSGIGVCIAANKFKGIRAGACSDTYSAHQSVEHDDVNVLCLGQRILGIALAREIVHAFLEARYSQQPHYQLRLGKIFAIENENMKEHLL